ncbi:MAG: (2Fe-2S)-binding protein [Myxococcota bacterium]
MIVCLCMATTDQDIDNAIRQGANTLEQVGESCDAGIGCGACHEYIAERIDELGAACPEGGCHDDDDKLACRSNTAPGGRSRHQNRARTGSHIVQLGSRTAA